MAHVQTGNHIFAVQGIHITAELFRAGAGIMGNVASSDIPLEHVLQADLDTVALGKEIFNKDNLVKIANIANMLIDISVPALTVDMLGDSYGNVCCYSSSIQHHSLYALIMFHHNLMFHHLDVVL